jgi:hypothetical protein
MFKYPQKVKGHLYPKVRSYTSEACLATHLPHPPPKYVMLYFDSCLTLFPWSLVYSSTSKIKAPLEVVTDKDFVAVIPISPNNYTLQEVKMNISGPLHMLPGKPRCYTFAEQYYFGEYSKLLVFTFLATKESREESFLPFHLCGLFCHYLHSCPCYCLDRSNAGFHLRGLIPH